ncbi:MAG TPA: acyl-ACP--UDP-N- acetylglucosamine O-acyltransferase [Candidatus Blautia pullicola]|uniref:Acyl-ACP--UDP-N- acetylglucosamine O-acyltransferase n=1 Tax=Candidatus Blautia pullicola TaxID=2838498 RepID=A0A9D2FTU9_9FIRM|nr:acyl-ACP--UDP-N- acetylglucosamine O-acyltransferase [Candidatus Blautia pullicola]
MKSYELIHEISDMCRGKMDSDISEIQTDDLDEYIKTHVSRAATWEKVELENGAVAYDVITNGLKERFTFSEI